MSAHDDTHGESSTRQLLPDPPEGAEQSAAERHPVATVWRGMTLTHQGHDLGVITGVSRSSTPGVAILHALGGISRSLEYAVPETAIVGVFGVSSRAIVSDGVEFEPRHLCADGRVILAPRTADAIMEPTDWARVPHADWVGVRVYADDGFLGTVQAALSSTRTGVIDQLVVRVRMPLRRQRFPVIAIDRLAAFAPAENVARVTGSRRELANMRQFGTRAWRSSLSPCSGGRAGKR